MSLITVIVMLVFFVTLLLGVPVAFSLICASLTAVLVNPKLTCDAVFILRSMVTGSDSFTFLAIPMFIFSGNLMATGKISDRLFDFVTYFVGKKRAGLPIAVVICCLFYGAITGSAPATLAAIGSMTIPLLVNLGYDKMFVTALVAVAASLGIIIPPSIPMVVYGLATSSVSVGDMFIAGIIPGCLIGLCLIVAAYLYCIKHGKDREKLDAYYYEIRSRGFWQVFKESSLALLCPVIILGGIYSGIATPTEVASISVIYALVVDLFIYKSVKLKDLKTILKDTAQNMLPMIFVCAAAMVFGRVLTMIQAPQQIAAVLSSITSSKILLLFIINLFLLFMGMIIDTGSAILICTPIFLPVVTSMGMSPIHFGIMMIVNLAIGYITPPVGTNLFVASAMTDIPMTKIAKKAIPFLLWFSIALLLITYIPGISLFLVKK